MTGRARTGRGWAGFSLLELMAVVLIMGILGGVVVVALGPKIFKARVSTTKSSMKTLKSELQAYYHEHTSYPATLRELDIDESEPILDGWDRDFYYKATPEGERPFLLISNGKDGKPNTIDDIDVWTMNVKTQN
ncbi:MAG: type II secretion system protein GspG [Planctomycetes bacterium]|nr:type II secretion system protein GspG [Planctomycetota bacterium]